MKFRLPATELAFALSGLSKIISNGTTLPVLKGIRVEAQGRHVTLSATDLDSYAAYTCRDAEVLEPGTAIVSDSKRLKTIVARAKQEEAAIRTVNADAVEVGLHGPSGDRLHVLVGLDPQEWPDGPPSIETQAVDPLFLQHYRTLMPFTSADTTRLILGGVCCEITPEGHTMVATDGRRLTCCNSIHLPLPATVVIPGNKLLAWPQLKGDTAMGVHSKQPWLRLQCGAWDTTLRLVEGTYPNWRQVVPGDMEAFCLMLAEEDVRLLEDAVKTLPGDADQSQPVTLLAGTPHPKVAGCDRETGAWSHQVLPHSQWNGEAPGITVNRSFLLDAVKAGFRQFAIRDELSPLVGRSGNGSLHVLMPLRSELPEDVQKAKEQPAAAQAAAGPAPGDDAGQEIQEPTPRKETNRMIQPKKNDETEDQTPDLWTQYQTVKEKARELNNAIAGLGQCIKGFHKEQKTVRVELDNARGVLAKLQSINI